MNTSYLKRVRHRTLLKRSPTYTAEFIRYLGNNENQKSPSLTLPSKQASSTTSISKSSESKKLKIIPTPPPSGLCDSIGPPDPVSNIRPVQFYIPPDESQTEKQFRLKRQEVLEWNKIFWTDHNTRFFQEKEKFIQDNQTKDSDGNVQQLSPEEMSVFYKTFLNKNWNSHLQYNKEWYKKNISLLWPALKVVFIRLRRKLAKNS